MHIKPSFKSRLSEARRRRETGKGNKTTLPILDMVILDMAR